MTGAELRAWRERLGKDEAWAAALLESLPGAPASAEIGCGPGQGLIRLRAAESVADGYAYHAFLRKTLRAALEAEEARQAAECGPVEPVCPEGVRETLGIVRDGRANTSIHLTATGGIVGSFAAVRIETDGRIFTDASGQGCSPALLEYAAALSRYRAAIHAASDRQRKLDAVRAAEEAHKVTDAACDAALAAACDAEDKYTTAYEAAIKTARALDAALREAGL